MLFARCGQHRAELAAAIRSGDLRAGVVIIDKVLGPDVKCGSIRSVVKATRYRRPSTPTV